jgi:hypothetical protein
MQTDLASHHIEGYANAALQDGATYADAHFDLPLISHIEGNLWMGGCIDGATLPYDFAHVISLYKWERYQRGPNTTLVEVKMYDSAEVPPTYWMDEIADMVNDRVEEGKTLVHCQAGLNRSGLISALSLIKRGWAPADAIALLRQQRTPLVLCNKTFEDWLLEQSWRMP